MFNEVPLPPRPAIPLSFYCLASVIAMESAETINPAMSEDTLRQRAALSN